MRKTVWPPPAMPQDGDQRVITKFLWRPKTLPCQGFREVQTRWLETAGIMQEYLRRLGGWTNNVWAPDQEAL